MRGASIESKSLQMGLEHFEQGNYKQAIGLFRAFLESKPNHFLANFYLGLTYLLNSTESMLGLPYRSNAAQIEHGNTYLNVAFIFEGENAFYQEDCLWYLGKAYLMLGKLPLAKQQFEQLINLNQPNLLRKNAARDLVVKIDAYRSK